MSFWQSFRLLPIFFLLGALCIPAAAQSEPASAPAHSAPHDPQADAAFDHFYNMDYDRATQEFEKIVEKRPNDPFALNHLLTVVLMHDLYETGAMNTGDYANDSFIGRTPRPTDSKIKERIKALVRRAENLEEQELKANPSDVNALYCRGVTRAQFSVYTGLIERAWFRPCATPSERATITNACSNSIPSLWTRSSSSAPITTWSATCRGA